MRTRALGLGFWAATACSIAGTAHAGHVVASFADDLQAPTPAPGWSYLWNSGGPIGNPGNYSALLPTGDALSLYDPQGSPVRPGPDPGAYLYIGLVPDFGFNPTLAGMAGGHPGRGYADSGSGGIERYAIAAYQVGAAGVYSITQSALIDAGLSSDGQVVQVYVNANPTPWITRSTTSFNVPVSFDVDLGMLGAGDTIYVAVGAGATDLRDTFALGFQIATVPEPSSLTLGSLGIITGISCWWHGRRRTGRSTGP
jgi:hypothetical protein